MVTIVDTEAKLQALVVNIENYGACAVDTESTGLHLVKDRIITIPITVGNDHCVIPTRLITRDNLDMKIVRKHLNPIFKSRKIIKYFWNFKYDRHMLANDRMGTFKNIHDGMLLAWLMDENRPKSLKERCQDVDLFLSKFPFSTYFRLRESYFRTMSLPKVADPGLCPTRKTVASKEDLVVAKEQWRRNKEAFRQYKKEVKPLSPKQYDDLVKMETELIDYAGEDTLATWELCNKYIPEIKTEEPKLWRVYKKVWKPFLDVLYSMERTGYAIDLEYLEQIRAECLKDIDKFEAEVFNHAGRVFKTEGPELATVLFDEFKCPVRNVSKKTGRPSADADTIELLSRIPKDEAHPYGTDGFEVMYPILKPLARLKKLKKLWGAFLSPDSALGKGIYQGRIHPSFNPCGTDTGRLSSSSPNAQQISRSSADNYYLRKIFIAPQGHSLGVFDQSQVELRTIADKTGDEKMVEAYNNGEDIHWKTAVGTGLDPVKERTIAKNLNFGAFYGIQDTKFSVILTVNTGKYVSEEEASGYLANMFELYKDVIPYKERVLKKLYKDGFVTSYLGRKRRLPEIYSPNRWERMRAERQAFNFMIQGGVADIMNYCMLRVFRDKWMRKNKIKLISQVHDEVHMIVPWGTDYKEFTRRLKEIFEYPFPGYDFKVPLLFEGNDTLAFSWNDAK